MDSMTLRQVERTGISEKRWLPERLKAPIAEETAGPAPRGTPDRCPGCGSAGSCRRGHDAHGLQRWRCRSCGRAFSARTGSALAMPELDAATWAAYAEGALAGMSPREPADGCSVCPRAPRSMGMRPSEAMGSAPAPFRKGSSASCQADGLCLDGSLAGSRGRPDIRMPGKAHAHGHAVHPRGISGRKACAERCASGLGDGYAAACGRGRPAGGGLEDALSGIAGSSRAAADGHAGYARVLPAPGVEEHAATAAEEAGNGEPGLADAMHQRLRESLLPFHGASTRWLGHCLACFLWTEQAKHSERERRGTLSGRLAGGRYVHTGREPIDMEQPFWSCWKDGAATSIKV